MAAQKILEWKLIPRLMMLMMSNIGVESSGVVYDTARPDKSTSGTSECSHGGHDRCICGMDESRG